MRTSVFSPVSLIELKTLKASLKISLSEDIPVPWNAFFYFYQNTNLAYMFLIEGQYQLTTKQSITHVPCQI